MRRCPMFDSPIALETLDLRLSPSSLVLGAYHGHLDVHAEDHHDRTGPGWSKGEADPRHGHLVVGIGVVPDDDPLPDPEPSPGPTPPVTYPQTPQSGPIGPGSS
jgi:hypothetical protein